MKEEAFLQPLVLKQKPRLMTQLAVSVILVVMAATAYFNFPDTVNSPGLESKFFTPIEDCPLWFSITIAFLSLVPAFYLFNHVNSELKLNVEEAVKK